MDELVPMRRAKQRLSLIWFGGSGLLLLMVIIQSSLGKYGDKTTEVFSWCFPTILPTLTLIAAVLGASARGLGQTHKNVDKFFYQLTLGISATYLIIVSLTLLLAPFSTSTPLEMMQMSNLWLGPLQGLVGGTLGVFFIRKEPDTLEEPARGARVEA